MTHDVWYVLYCMCCMICDVSYVIWYDLIRICGMCFVLFLCDGQRHLYVPALPDARHRGVHPNSAGGGNRGLHLLPQGGKTSYSSDGLIGWLVDWPADSWSDWLRSAFGQPRGQGFASTATKRQNLFCWYYWLLGLLIRELLIWLAEAYIRAAQQETVISIHYPK